MTSVFVKADPPAPEGLVFVKPEPLDSVLSKWLAWILGLTVFLLGLIYFTTNFSKLDISCNTENKYDEDEDDLPNLLVNSKYTTSAQHIPHLDIGQDAVQSVAPLSKCSVVNTPISDTLDSNNNTRTGFTVVAPSRLEILDYDYCDEYDVYGNCIVPFTPLAFGGLGGYYGFGGRRHHWGGWRGHHGHRRHH